MCGREANLFLVEVEGAMLRLCNSCAKYGKVIRKVNAEKPKLMVKKNVEKEEPILVIVDNFAKIIKDKRESLNLNLEQFARMLNEKESLMHHIESGKREPSIKLARKMKKILKINLIEEVKEQELKLGRKSSENLTIGDLIKIKK